MRTAPRRRPPVRLKMRSPYRNKRSGGAGTDTPALPSCSKPYQLIALGDGKEFASNQDAPFRQEFATRFIHASEFSHSSFFFFFFVTYFLIILFLYFTRSARLCVCLCVWKRARLRLFTHGRAVAARSAKENKAREVRRKYIHGTTKKTATATKNEHFLFLVTFASHQPVVILAQSSSYIRLLPCRYLLLFIIIGSCRQADC